MQITLHVFSESELSSFLELIDGALVLAAFCFGISALQAILSGWYFLAKRFRPTGVIKGEDFMFVSASIGFCDFGNFLFLKVGQNGLYVSVFFLLRAFNPPFFIAWNEVASVTERRSWFSKVVVIHIRNSSIKIMVSGFAGETILKTYKNFSSSE